MKKVWAEIREKESNNLIRIIYNPYRKSKKDILKYWVIEEEIKNCKVIFTN